MMSSMSINAIVHINLDLEEFEILSSVGDPVSHPIFHPIKDL